MEEVVPKSTRRNLRYDFTAVEVHEMSLRLANKHMEIAQKQEEAKSIASDYSAKINILKAEQTKLANHVVNGFEWRDVECSIEYNKPIGGRKLLTRSDTGQTIEEKMEPYEFNLFTQVTEDDKLALQNPDTTVKKKSKKKQERDTFLDELESGII